MNKVVLFLSVLFTLSIISCSSNSEQNPINLSPTFWPSAPENLVVEKTIHNDYGTFTRFTFSPYIFLYDEYIDHKYVYIYGYDNPQLLGEPVWSEWWPYQENSNTFLTRDFEYAEYDNKFKNKTVWFIAFVKVTAHKAPFTRFSDKGTVSNGISF